LLKLDLYVGGFTVELVQESVREEMKGRRQKRCELRREIGERKR